jgi:ribonuclease P protein component
MLAKNNRFHGHQGVRRVYKQGGAHRGSLGSLHVSIDAKRKEPRVAVVVSRKVDKSAVVRNRIRRRVYEEVRRLLPEFTQPAELVFTIYQVETATIPTEELAAEIQGLLKRAKLL